MLAPGGGSGVGGADHSRAGATSRWVAAVWPIAARGLPVDDPDLAPIWQAMDETEPAVSCHHSFFYEPPYFPGYRDIWGNAVVARTAAHVWGAERAAGLHPGQRHARPLPEPARGHRRDRPRLAAQLDPAPDQPGRLRQGRPCRELQHTPLEYVQQGRVFCGIENHEGPLMTKAVVDILGDGVLMYQSDYPHPESLFPAGVDTVIGWRAVLGETATAQADGRKRDALPATGVDPWDTVNGSTSRTIKAGAPASGGL